MDGIQVTGCWQETRSPDARQRPVVRPNAGKRIWAPLLCRRVGFGEDPFHELVGRAAADIEACGVRVTVLFETLELSRKGTQENQLLGPFQYEIFDLRKRRWLIRSEHLARLLFPERSGLQSGQAFFSPLRGLAIISGEIKRNRQLQCRPGIFRGRTQFRVTGDLFRLYCRRPECLPAGIQRFTFVSSQFPLHALQVTRVVTLLGLDESGNERVRRQFFALRQPGLQFQVGVRRVATAFQCIEQSQQHGNVERVLSERGAAFGRDCHGISQAQANEVA